MDLHVCKPRMGPDRYRGAARSGLSFSLNARNTYGGNAGQVPYLGSIDDGRFTISAIDFNGDIKARLLLATTQCPLIPAAVVRRAMDE